MEEKHNNYCDMDYLVCDIIKKILKRLEIENRDEIHYDLNELTTIDNKMRCN